MSIGLRLPEECKRTQSIKIPEFLESALRICFTRGKSEKLPNNSYYPLFVGDDLIEQMLSPENHLIWGRRGTGKTHLLKAFVQRVNQDNSLNSIAYFISCDTIKCETPKALSFEDDRQRMRYFAHETFKSFMISIIDQIIDSYKEYLANKSFFYSKGTAEKKTFLSKIDGCLDKLLDVSINGKARTVKQEGQKTTNKITKTTKNGKINLGMNSGKFTMGNFLSNLFSFEKEYGKQFDTSSAEELPEKIIYEYRFSDISACLDMFIKTMELETLYICIDELWLIDDKNEISFQPLFLEYLKEVFFSLNNTSIKIASIRETTNINSKVSMSNSYGLQSGHDIIELADLDSMYFDSNMLRSKFSEILAARVNYFIHYYQAPHAPYTDKDYKFESEYIIDIVFKDVRHFNTLLELTHGIPRNFLYIIRLCLNAINFKLTHNFLHCYLISEAVVSVYINDRRSNMPMNKESAYSIISEYAKNNKSCFFLVTTEHYKRVKIEINNLISTEIIHRIPSSLTPIAIMNYFKAFFIDAGKYLFSLKSEGDESYANALSLFKLMIPKDVSENYQKYVIDFDSVTNLYKECPNCGQTFSEKHPIYLETGRCFTCAFVINAPQKHFVIK